MAEVPKAPNNWRCGDEHVFCTRTHLQLFSTKYRTFHIGLLAYYDEEPKHLPKFGGLVSISVTRCRKIRGAKSLEKIRYTLGSIGQVLLKRNTFKRSGINLKTKF